MRCLVLVLGLAACHADLDDVVVPARSAPPPLVAAVPRALPALPPAEPDIDVDEDAEPDVDIGEADVEVVEPDRDGDHDVIVDTVDRCPDAPEDVDGYEDVDGCPDVDVDVDPVLVIE